MRAGAEVVIDRNAEAVTVLRPAAPNVRTAIGVASPAAAHTYASSALQIPQIFTNTDMFRRLLSGTFAPSRQLTFTQADFARGGIGARAHPVKFVKAVAAGSPFRFHICSAGFLPQPFNRTDLLVLVGTPEPLSREPIATQLGDRSR